MSAAERKTSWRDSSPSIGTSGFSYRDWKGAFYPDWLPARDWFHFYATRFPAVEINLTFYRPVSRSTLLRWKASAPAGFRFVLKSSQEITHRKRLEDCGDDLRALAEEFAPLGDQLACVLFQLPPSLRRDDHRLEAFLKLACPALKGLPGTAGRAIEFRHDSWNAPETLDRLTEHGWGLVLHDMPGAGGWTIRDGRLAADGWSPSIEEWLEVHPPLIYLRFHGTTGKYAGEYGEAGLRPWADLARSTLGRRIPVHAYFNNTIAGGAARDAAVLQGLLKTG